ncbi:MAG: B12-binding domain-containing radical SAM protein [Chloroflexi bacterium]|nr:B12-binding domain-containing radical SAM protein [Chloroflexota bacterium]
MNIDKIVLVYPKRDGLIFGRAHGSPYTLMRLASLVPPEIPVEIWDEDLHPIDFNRVTPHTVMGITSKTLSIDRAKQIASDAKKRGATVVVGGTHVTLAPDDVAPWADAIVVGEAYRTWPQIIHDVANDNLQPAYVDEEWAPLAGVAPLTDRVIKMVNEKKHYWTPYLEITRGCPRNCTFCTAIRVSGKIMRHRPIDEVVDEIARRGIKRFFLTDDNFGLNFRTDPNYIAQLFDALKKLPLNGWTAQAEMMVGEFPELLEMARHAHLDKFFIGFESVNAGNIRELGGKTKGSQEKYKQIINEIHRHGIGVVGLFVFGFDHDTPQVFEDTWKFVRESELDGVSVTILTPYPGTPQRDQWIAENRLMPDTPWSLYDTSHVTYYPKLMTVDQLREGYDWMCRRLYNPASILARGARAMRRVPLAKERTKFFSTFSTDFGYRKTYSFRDQPVPEYGQML